MKQIVSLGIVQLSWYCGVQEHCVKLVSFNLRLIVFSYITVVFVCFWLHFMGCLRPTKTSQPATEFTSESEVTSAASPALSAER